MAHVWMPEGERGWEPVALGRSPVTLAQGQLQPAPDPLDAGNAGDQVLLIPAQDAADDRWVLVAPPAAAVWVNGRRLSVGARVLRDKDAIRLAGGDCHFFSKERVARVETFEDTGLPTDCPRCKQPFHSGDPVVRCPGCGVAHHQAEDQGLPCWTGYSDRPFAACALCDRPATLGGELSWTPHQL